MGGSSATKRKPHKPPVAQKGRTHGTERPAADAALMFYGLLPAVVSIAVVLVAVVAAAFVARSESTATVLVQPNGGGAVAFELNISAWHAELHLQFPEAMHIGLWDASGVEVCWSDVNGSHSPVAALGRLPADALLTAVLDQHPFMWPPSPHVRDVDVGGGQLVQLRTLSDAPRVFAADDVLSAEECDAIRAAGRPHMTGSVAFKGGQSVVAEEEVRIRMHTYTRADVPVDVYTPPVPACAHMHARMHACARCTRMHACTR